VLGPEMVRQTTDYIEIIRQRMKAAQDRQKSYADKDHKDMEFDIDDMVFVKISPLKNVIRFGSKGKLAPRFVGPFPIIERIGKLAYRLDLPEKMSSVHNVFHVSCLRKCVHDSIVVVSPDSCEDFEVNPVVSRPRKPFRVVGTDTKQLRRKVVKLLKVQWSENDDDCTWKTEENIKATHPKFFKVRPIEVMSFYPL